MNYNLDLFFTKDDFIEFVEDIKYCELDTQYSAIQQYDINKKVASIILNNPIGSLDKEFVEVLVDYSWLFRAQKSKDFTHFDITLNIYKDLYLYIIANDLETKNIHENNLERNFNAVKNNILTLPDALVLAKPIYNTQNQDLINLFEKILTIPPTSIFDSKDPPKTLFLKELSKKDLVSKFTIKNKPDKLLESKITFLQRIIRANARFDSERNRIGYAFPYRDPNGIMEDASTPYEPKECSRELAQRIMRVNENITLYKSATHYCALNNITAILDGILYGRENLIHSFINFRPASLGLVDIRNGDQNVICLAPNKVDDNCLEGDTIGLEFDINMIIKDGFKGITNPIMFFKQQDLGYNKHEIKTIMLKDLKITFTFSQDYYNDSQRFFLLGMLDELGGLEYYSSLENSLLISYNINEMDKIFILNFFRFLDSLKNVKDGSKATEKIAEIYSKIESLNDDELNEFFKTLGYNMSSASEFNIYGAHKINLNTLKAFSIYSDGNFIKKIEINELFAQLNAGHFVLFDELKNSCPRILQSKKFKEFLITNISNSKVIKLISNV